MALPGSSLPAQARAGDNVTNHLLNLQRDYGNTAVTLEVQRKGGRPQSTDAPGKRGKKVVKKAAEDDFSPKTFGEASAGRDIGWLIAQGNTYMKSAQSSQTPKGKAMAYDRAADYYLGVMWIDPSPANSQYLTRLYRETKDEARLAYWMKVQTRQIVLAKHKAGEEAPEDMTGKEF